MKRKTKPTKPKAIVTDTAEYAFKCPKCDTPIAAQATVTAFNEPAAWNFWGYPGERWQRCKGESGGHQYIHFRTIINNQFSERLAWIKPAAVTAATQETLL